MQSQPLHTAVVQLAHPESAPAQAAGDHQWVKVYKIVGAAVIRRTEHCSPGRMVLLPVPS